jgi:hypothetical protein
VGLAAAIRFHGILIANHFCLRNTLRTYAGWNAAA